MILGLIACTGGCETKNSAGVGGAKKQASVAELMKELDKHTSIIKSAFEKKTPDDAHDSLHEVGHVLESIEKSIAGQLKTDAQKASVSKAIKELFDSYGALDEAMHGGKGKSMDDVSKTIDESMKVLKSIAP
jgi:hypothetical protein